MAAWLAVAGAALLCVGGLLAAPEATGRAWRAAVGFAVAAAALGVLWLTPPEGASKSALLAPATLATGEAATVTVTVTGADGGRDTLLVPLDRPIPGGLPLLYVLAGLGVLVGAASTLSRPRAGLERASAAALAAVAVAASVVLLLSAGSSSGPDAARAATLAAGVARAGTPLAFVPPAVEWLHRPFGVSALVGVAGLAVFSALVGLRRAPALGPLRWVGALLLAAAPAVQLVVVDGLPWRGAEGALWVAGFCGVAAVLTTEERHVGPLAAAALVLAVFVV